VVVPRLFPLADATRCQRHGDRVLLYAGISPRRPPGNGRPPSRQDLRGRPRTHYLGNAEGSTLRLLQSRRGTAGQGISRRRIEDRPLPRRRNPGRQPHHHRHRPTTRPRIAGPAITQVRTNLSQGGTLHERTHMHAAVHVLVAEGPVRLARLMLPQGPAAIPRRESSLRPTAAAIAAGPSFPTARARHNAAPRIGEDPGSLPAIYE
jgi:hypothetical protein